MLDGAKVQIIAALSRLGHGRAVSLRIVIFAA
jgi:hypothetical protein